MSRMREAGWFQRKEEKAVVVCLFLAAVLSTSFITYTYAVVENTTKPSVVTGLFVDPVLKVEAVQWNYDSGLNRYSTVSVTVKNYDTSVAASGTIEAKVYETIDLSGAAIATGSTGTGSISAGASLTVAVGLTWTSGKNVTHARSWKIECK